LQEKGIAPENFTSIPLSGDSAVKYRLGFAGIEIGGKILHSFFIFCEVFKGNVWKLQWRYPSEHENSFFATLHCSFWEKRRNPAMEAAGRRTKCCFNNICPPSFHI